VKILAQLGLMALVLSLSACQSTSEANAGKSGARAELRNTLWKLTSMNGQAMQTTEGQRMASLTLSSEDSRARITTVCNSGSAVFTTDGSKIKFDIAMATKMMCPPEQMEQEAGFFKAIRDTTHYQIKAEILELYNADNKLVATFHSAYLK
jgi:heat shock protein HslJ